MIQKTPFKTEFCSDRDRIRTYDRLLRRQMLYPAELRDLVSYMTNMCLSKLQFGSFYRSKISPNYWSVMLGKNSFIW